MQTNRSGVVPFIRQEERNARYMRALCPLFEYMFRLNGKVEVSLAISN
jgi:hypothetical protein